MKLLGMSEEERLEFEQTTGIKTEAMQKIVQSATKQSEDTLQKAIREVQEVVGPHGSISRVQAGGVRITREGVGVFEDGIAKTSIDSIGNLFVGSDIDDPSTTTLAVFVSEQTYNSEAMGAGDMLIGDNSNDRANIHYDASEGRLEFRGGQTVRAYVDTDGSIVAGDGDIVLDEIGIVIANSTTSGLAFLDDAGNRDTIHIVADANNDFEFVNIAETPSGTISFFIKDTAGVTRRPLRIAEAALANALSVHMDEGSAGSIFTIGDEVAIYAAVDGQTTVFNDGGHDIDFRIESDNRSDTFVIDGGADTASFFSNQVIVHQPDSFVSFFGNDTTGIVIIDGGAEERLEIGQDHYFPTRNSSNPNGFWNEANEDMDFTFEGADDAIVLKMDAGLNAIGIGGAAESGYKLKVHGNVNLSDTSAYYIDGTAVVTEAARGLAPEVQTQNIFAVSSPGGASLWTGTISGTPSGTSVTVSAPATGTEGVLKPTATTQLAKLRLYNLTRSNSALISDYNTGTNVVTLTATVPANWANTDSLTVASQTVSGGGFNWVDLEITSGPTGRSALLLTMLLTSGAASDEARCHPLEAHSGAKRGPRAITQVAAVSVEAVGLTKITSNVFSLAWTANSTQLTIFETAYQP